MLTSSIITAPRSLVLASASAYGPDVTRYEVYIPLGDGIEVKYDLDDYKRNLVTTDYSEALNYRISFEQQIPNPFGGYYTVTGYINAGPKNLIYNAVVVASDKNGNTIYVADAIELCEFGIGLRVQTEEGPTTFFDPFLARKMFFVEQLFSNDRLFT